MTSRPEIPRRRAVGRERETQMLVVSDFYLFRREDGEADGPVGIVRCQDDRTAWLPFDGRHAELEPHRRREPFSDLL